MNGNSFDKIVARINTVKLTELPDEFEPTKDEASFIANSVP